MKIAITSRTLSNRSDLVKTIFSIFGEENVKLNIYDDSLKDEKLISFLKDVDLVILGTEPFHKNIIASLPNLKAVIKYGVGIDNINFEACKKYNIPVHYKKGTNSDAVAEITLSYIIQLLRNQHISFSSARNNKWNKTVGKELRDSTVTIVGVGNIGSCLKKKLNYLNCGKIFEYDTKFICEPLSHMASQSDLVTVHIDNEKMTNTNFINDNFFQYMNDGAYLVNTSRGSIMNYDDLKKHIDRLGGVAVDVYPDEPLIPEWMYNHPKVIMSCHICGSSLTALKNGEQFILDKIYELKELYS